MSVKVIVLVLLAAVCMAEVNTCSIVPACKPRNRHPCEPGSATCGPCLDGFTTSAGTGAANTPCEKATSEDEKAVSDLELPVIDVSIFIDETNASAEEKAKEAKRLLEAATGPGFMFLNVTRTGITEELVSSTFADVAQFFDLPLSAKMELAYKDNTANTGYVAVGAEALDSDAAEGDPKESLDISLQYLKETEAINSSALVSYWSAMERVKDAFLTGLGLSLELDDPAYFVERHNKQDNNLRILHYPPTATKPLYRAGPHTDYGSITLLMLKEGERGLEVFDRRSGGWAEVEPISGTVVVNIADLLQRWSSDLVQSTVHRVVSMGDSHTRSRYSIPYFVNPNFDHVVSSSELAAISPKIDASLAEQAYPDILSLDYLTQRLSATIPVEDNDKDEL